MRFLIIIFILINTLGNVHAQLNLDSIKAVVHTLPSDSLKVMSYFELVIAYNRLDYDSALKYAQKAEELSKENGSKHLLARSNYRNATVYIKRDEDELAYAELDTAITLSTQVRDSMMLLSSKIEKGRLSKLNSNFDRAVKELFSALELAEIMEEKNAQARIKNYLASIYHYQSQYDLSIRYYTEALSLVRELNFKPGISAILTNLGETYLRIKNYDSVIFYQRKALHIKSEIGDKLGIGRVFVNMANFFMDSDSSNPDSSLYYYQKGLAIGREIKDTQLNALSLYGLVQVQFFEGNFNDAKSTANELIIALNSIEDLTLESKSFEQISLVYAGLGDIEKALEYQKKGKILSDSLLSNERVKLSQEIEAKYQSEAKQRAIDLLESENELQELSISKSRNERNGLIILSIVTLLALGLLINQYRIKQKANQKLRELDRMKTSFFENLSHEFRTPLTLIMAPLKERMIRADHEEKKVLRLALKNAEKLLKLINELLDLAKLEAGRLTVDKSSTEISQFFKLIAASYDSYASSKSIVFNVEVPEEEIWLMLDQEILTKVCNNLLSNAFKFTSEGGEVHLNVQYKSSVLTVQVADDGVGVPVKDQEKIFNRFEQGERSGKLQQGTGIGLALVKELTKAHNGKVVLETTSDEGATFTVSIPVEKGTAKESARISAEQFLAMEHDTSTPEVVDHSEGDSKVLVIEDNDELRNYISGLLSKSYQVLTAANGKEAVDMALTQIPDLIISDVMMPEMDGLELCKALSQNKETDHIPIILLTARADKETKLSGLQLGAIQYITKPFEPEELKITINNIVEQQRKVQDKYLSEKSSAKGHELHPFIKKCEEIVMMHLDNTAFDISLFAREVGMSRMQLHRKLVALTKLSATAFIRHHRLTKAKALLKAGESVSQAAYSVGFSSLSYFTTSFKEAFGIRPSEYEREPI
ncbi:MAG: response regulator [Bacteroidota bacterium]